MTTDVLLERRWTSLGCPPYSVTTVGFPEPSSLGHRCKGSGLTVLPSLCAAEGLMHSFSWVCCAEEEFCLGFCVGFNVKYSKCITLCKLLLQGGKSCAE